MDNTHTHKLWRLLAAFAVSIIWRQSSQQSESTSPGTLESAIEIETQWQAARIDYCWRSNSGRRSSAAKSAVHCSAPVLFLFLPDKDLATWQTSSNSSRGSSSSSRCSWWESEGDKWHYNRIECSEGTTVDDSEEDDRDDSEGTQKASEVGHSLQFNKWPTRTATTPLQTIFWQTAFCQRSSAHFAYYCCCCCCCCFIALHCSSCSSRDALQIIDLAIYLIIAPLHAHSPSFTFTFFSTHSCNGFWSN